MVIPDILLVTDQTEVANGCEPKYGLKPVVDKATEKIIPSKKKE